MEILRPSPLEGLLAKIGGWFVGQAQAPLPDTAALLDLYNGGMFAQGNFFHRQILARWAEAIRVDETNLEALRIRAQQGIFVYITRNIGQLEFIVLNHILAEQKLPPAVFNNTLRARRWLPLKKFFGLYGDRIGFLSRRKKLPDPLACGLLGKTLLYSLQEWDPEFMLAETQNFLDKLLEFQKQSDRPIYLVPCPLIWDRRPRREQASILEVLFGENERPGRWRKLILFFRHYKKWAIQKFGEPIPLAPFQDGFSLYQKMVGELQMERKSLTGPVIHSHQWFLDHTLEDEGLTKTIYEVAKEKRRPVDDIGDLALNYAKEIAADLRYHYIELVAALLHPVFRNLFEGLVIDTEGIKRLKKTLKVGPVILTPNHRSHLDYLLLGFLCHQHDIVSPYVAAGINMAFWPMGKFFRRCGAFFLRRSFEGNLLYKKTFQTYLKILVREGYLQEFFIEGGRSRTGKLRAPKLGMLSMYSEALHEGAAGDLFFMPVSITYDKVLEEKSYIEEMGGKPKQKEKFTDIFRLPKFLKGRYGKIYVNFDEALSWQQAASQVEAENWEAKKPKIVQHLANQICHAINRQVVATPKALAAASLLNTPRQGVAVAEAEALALRLAHYLEWKKVPLSATLAKNRTGALKEAFHQLESSGLIKRRRGLDKHFFEIPREKRVAINLFKNISLHRFVSLSILSALLLSGRGKILWLEQLANEFVFFQDLFQYEFRFSTRRPVPEHLDTLCCYLKEHQAIHFERGEIEILPEGRKILKQWALLMQNYLEAYWIVWETLLLKPTEPLGGLGKVILNHAKDALLLGRIQYQEAVSPIIFENALQSFQILQPARQLKASLEKLMEI